MPPTLKQRLLAGGSWVFLGKAVTATANLLVGSLLARLLTPEDFGAYGLAFTVITVGTFLTQLGLQQTVVRLVAESMGSGRPGRARAVVRLAYRHVALAILVAVVVLFLGVGAWLAGGIWASPSLAAAMPAVTAWLAVTSLQVLNSETFRGFQDLRLASTFGGVISGAATLAVLAIFVAVRGTASLGEVVWISAGATAASLLLGLAVLHRKLAPLPKHEPIARGEVFSIALPLWVTGVTAYLLSQAPFWILGAFLPKDQVGLYFAALRLVTLVSMPLILVNLVVPPFVAELHSRGEKTRLQRVLRSAATFAGLPAFVVLAAFVLFGEPIMVLVFGEPYRGAAPILALLSVGYLVSVWSGSCGKTLAMTGHQTVLMVLTLAGGTVSVVGALLVVQRYGVLGVAAVACGTSILLNISMWLAARHYVGVWTHAKIPTRRDVRELFSRPPVPEVDQSSS